MQLAKKNGEKLENRIQIVLDNVSRVYLWVAALAPAKR